MSKRFLCAKSKVRVRFTAVFLPDPSDSQRRRGLHSSAQRPLMLCGVHAPSLRVPALWTLPSTSAAVVPSAPGTDVAVCSDWLIYHKCDLLLPACTFARLQLGSCWPCWTRASVDLVLMPALSPLPGLAHYVPTAHDCSHCGAASGAQLIVFY